MTDDARRNAEGSPRRGISTAAVGVGIGVAALVGAWLVPPLLARLFSESPGLRSYRFGLGLLLYGLALTLPTWRRSGLRIGTIREHWKGVLLVCGGPVLLTLLVYPNLPERPFAHAGPGMWLVSPLAQDLVFLGFILGQLEPRFPRPFVRRLGAPRALVVGAAFFAAWHLPNFCAHGISTGYVVFQLGYTAGGFLLVGLSRVWTGSILYGVLEHSLVNLIAWWFS